MLRPLRSKFLMFWIISFTLLILPGCWDRKELEDTAFIELIGLDKGPMGGALVTVQIPIPSKIGGEGGGEGPRTLVTSVEAPTIGGAFNLINTNVGRRLTFIQGEAIVIGESLAQDREAMQGLLRSFARAREIRGTILMIVVKGKAMDFLKVNEPVIEANPAKYLEFLAESANTTGMMTNNPLHDIIAASYNYGAEPFMVLGASKPKQLAEEEQEQGKPKEPPLEGAYTAGNVPRAGGNKTELMGTAVFQQSKMVGQLTGNETRILHILTGGFRRAYMSFADPMVKGKFMVISLSQGSLPVIKTKLQDGKAIVNVKVSLEGDLTANQSGINYATDPVMQKKLEKNIQNILHTLCLALIRKTQEEFKSDIFGFGNKVRHNFLTWDQWTSYNWPAKFPEAEIHVQLDFDIRRVGLTLTPADFN